ncbi:MAG TPA: hypothetical protein VGK16_08020, partial [Candidatus Limnocylindrales bacterium]
MTGILRRAATLLATSVVAVALIPVQPALALTYPGTVWSYYMSSVSTSTVYDLGCTLGTARKDGSAPQDALVFLDFGQAQLRNGVYGTWDFSNTYRTVTQVQAASVAYAHGFYVCT